MAEAKRTAIEAEGRDEGSNIRKQCSMRRGPIYRGDREWKQSNGGDRGRPRRLKGREGTDGHRGNSRVRDRDGRFRVGRDRFRGNRSNVQSLSGERSGDGTKMGIKDTCNDTATDEEERQEGW